MLSARIYKIRRPVKIAVSVLICVLAFGVGVLGSYFFLATSRIFVKTDPVGNKQDDVVDPSILAGSFNVLLLGYGGRGHDGGYLSDVIMVLHVNPKEKRAHFISIPRDLWVEIPVRSDKREFHKINAAYAIGHDDRGYGLKEPQYRGEAGAVTMTKEVTSDVVGMTIEYFIAVDFDGFKKIVDTLDGVEVDVPVTFEDSFYPVKGKENETCGFSASKIAEFHAKYSGFDLEKQFTCRYEQLRFDKGKVKMNGETALKFVRSRHSAQHGGDFARSQRQQALLLGLREKFISLNAVKNSDKLFSQLSDTLRTDLDLVTIKKLIEMNGDIKDYKVSFISLNDQNTLLATKSFDGQFILIPKEGEGVWTGVQNFLMKEISKSD